MTTIDCPDRETDTETSLEPTICAVEAPVTPLEAMIEGALALNAQTRAAGGSGVVASVRWPTDARFQCEYVPVCASFRKA